MYIKIHAVAKNSYKLSTQNGIKYLSNCDDNGPIS